MRFDEKKNRVNCKMVNGVCFGDLKFEMSVVKYLIHILFKVLFKKSIWYFLISTYVVSNKRKKRYHIHVLILLIIMHYIGAVQYRTISNNNVT